MKQIKVNAKCNGCGLCIVNSSYLQENDEGNAQPVPGKAIKDADLKDVERIVEECPEKALLIIDTGKATASGIAGVKQVLDALKNQCNSINVKRVNCSDVRLTAKKYGIDIPYSNKEYKRDYTSESSAKSAARDEFNRLCYSENAYRPLIKKVFVEYKVNVLKPYYNCEDVPESAYYKYNEIVRKQLADAYAEICQLIGEGKLLPSWKDFSIFPKQKDWSIEALREFDERSTRSGIISDLKDRGEYTSLSWYVDRMDYDYDEQYVGEGLFGKSKYKNMYYFSGFREEAKEFVDDLMGSIDSMSGDIEEGAVGLINSVFNTFEEELKKAYTDKIEELKKFL